MFATFHPVFPTFHPVFPVNNFYSFPHPSVEGIGCRFSTEIDSTFKRPSKKSHKFLTSSSVLNVSFQGSRQTGNDNPTKGSNLSSALSFAQASVLNIVSLLASQAAFFVNCLLKCNPSWERKGLEKNIYAWEARKGHVEHLWLSALKMKQIRSIRYSNSFNCLLCKDK